MAVRIYPPTVEPMQMIRVDHNVGDGEPSNPYRVVSDYYRADGTFVFRVDPNSLEAL